MKAAMTNPTQNECACGGGQENILQNRREFIGEAMQPHRWKIDNPDSSVEVHELREENRQLRDVVEKAIEEFWLISKFTGGELTRITIWRKLAEAALLSEHGGKK